MMEASVKTTRIYEKVVEKLKEEIADGRLLPGSPTDVCSRATHCPPSASSWRPSA